MRLFVVEVNDGGAEGEFETREEFVNRLSEVWHVSHRYCIHGLGPGRDACEDRQQAEVKKLKALDEALLATIDVAHVGMVIPYRLGWVFIAEDALS